MNEKEIKKWFETWATQQQVDPLPTDHTMQFKKRLQKYHNKENFTFILKAAVLLLLLGIVGVATYFMLPTPPEVIQFQKVENHFFYRIETQLEELRQNSSPNIQKMIQHSQTQLEQMQSDYKKLHAKWEENPMQPQLINALIKNLKRQSELLEYTQSSILQLQHLNYETL